MESDRLVDIHRPLRPVCLSSSLSFPLMMRLRGTLGVSQVSFKDGRRDSSDDGISEPCNLLWNLAKTAYPLRYSNIEQLFQLVETLLVQPRHADAADHQEIVMTLWCAPLTALLVGHRGSTSIRGRSSRTLVQNSLHGDMGGPRGV